jgi:drug/metabolite transporter (DMT)-like permease
VDWVILTFISVACRSVYGVMTKVLSNKLKASAYTQATLLPLAGAFIALLISPLMGGINFNVSDVSLVAVVLVVLGQGLGNVVYFASIKNLTNGTAQIAFSSILLFNTFLSLVFLELSLNFVNMLGLFLLALAILSAVTGKIELHRRGVALMVLSAFLFSVFQLSSAEISKQVGAATYLLIAYLGAAAVVFALKWKVVINDLSVARNWSALTIPLLTALPSLGNFLFAYYAYRTAPEPAKVAMLLTSQVVLTVFLSYIFLKERGHLVRKASAAVLVVISAVLIKG